MAGDDDIVYAYVEGYDLAEVAPVLRKRLADLLSSASWSCRVWLVDQQHEERDLKPGDLPAWDLGVNLDSESAPEAGYRKDLVSLYRGLSMIGADTGREFIFGIHGEDCVSTEERLEDAELVRLLG